MDETKETPQGTPPQGQSSEGPQGSTSGTTTYTEEQVQKRISDERAQAGRKVSGLEKQVKTLSDQLNEATQRHQSLQKQMDDAKLEAARDNPQALNLYQQEQQLRQQQEEIAKQKREIEQSKAEHEQELQEARDAKNEIEVWNVAQKYGVDASVLKGLGLQGEQLENVAKAMGQGKPAAPSVATDSNVTSGAGVDFSKMSPTDKIKYGLEQQKKK